MASNKQNSTMVPMPGMPEAPMTADAPMFPQKTFKAPSIHAPKPHSIVPPTPRKR